MEEKLKRLDRILIAVFGVAWLISQLYFSLIKPTHPMIQVPMFLSFAIAITYIKRPLKIKYLRILDYICAGLSFYVAYYYFTNFQTIIYRIPHISPILTSDIVAVVILVVLLMEAVRRALGLNLFFFVLFFIVYAFFGRYFPGFLKFSGMSIQQFCEVVGMGTEGIFGTSLSTTANYIFFFMLFGAFFSVCGGGQLLIDVGLRFSSGSGSGAPAQAAVISSGLMGMVSGSAVANVSTTGVMTIPMMKKVGYTPEQAGAIEAVASTGGQIMPPIMGAGAFIMAELLGVAYGEIATRAIIPACAYFGSVLMLVFFLAKRNVANGPAQDGVDARFDVAPLLPRVYTIIPAILLVYMVMSGSSLRSAAIYGTTLTILIFLVIRKYNVDLKKNILADLKTLWGALLDGITQSAGIALPTGVCGIIIVIVVQSGLANKFSGVIAAVGGTHLFLALLITVLGCMLLGMALPTVAAYLVAVVLFIPTLQRLDVPLMVAHFFCFYFGIVAQITPPVCMASFTAAGIASADPWKTGWTGFRYALVAFLIPFVFVYQPAVLLLGTPLEIVQTVVVLALGTVALASSMAGYLFSSLNMMERGVLLVSALLLITPEMITDVVGAVLFIAVVAFSLKNRHRQSASKEIQDS